MDTPHVLLLAYYFPPLGLSGVQRSSKFVKYLPDYGWDVTVLTVRPGGYFAFDNQLRDELNRPGISIKQTGSLDPTRIFGSGRTVRAPSDATRSRWSAISQSVFLPDNKIGWFPAAVRAGKQVIEQHPVDVVLSSAPPYSSHLIAKRLTRRHGLPLVVDFRDDWLQNPRHTYPTSIHRSIQARMERSVIEAADAIITINDHIAGDLGRRHPGSASDIRVIPQGFDPEDYRQSESVRTEGSQKTFTLIYSGVFYDAQQPDTFLSGLAGLLARRPELRSRVRAEFVGLLSDRHKTKINDLGLKDVVIDGGYVSHQEAMRRVQQASVAWMTVGRQEGGEQISTGKLYAYMGARIPVLGLVPEGAARTALMEYGAGSCVPPDDVESAEKTIESLYDAWSEGTLPAPNQDVVSRHDRKRLSGELSQLLRRVTEDFKARR